MAEIRMPSLGADMDAGTLVEWKVRPGEHVARGTIVALIETQKATMEMESFVEGTIDALLVEAGAKVAVGTVIATVRTTGVADAPAPVATVPATTAPVASTPRAPAPIAPAPIAPAPAPVRHVASPAARKLAREHGIDLTTVQPSGPRGAIVLRDVEAALAAPAPSAPAPPAPSAPAPALTPAAAPPARSPRPAPHDSGGMRDAIAAAMSRSKREIPHYYLAHTISLRRALAWLAEQNAHRPVGERILPGALLLRAVVLALWEVPELNGTFVDGAFRPSEAVHLGNAISLRTGGVIAPALLDADDRSLDQLMADLRDLVTRARAGRLRSGELTAATITVTSLGDRGCEAVWPVINPPQVAIVGFGAVLDRPWAEGGQLAVHPTVVATLAADHRVSDGHRGGLFLHALDHALQEPEHL